MKYFFQKLFIGRRKWSSFLHFFENESFRIFATLILGLSTEPALALQLAEPCKQLCDHDQWDIKNLCFNVVSLKTWDAMRSKLVKATANRPFITIVYIAQEKLLPARDTATPSAELEYTIEDLIHDTHQVINYRYTEVLVMPTYKTLRIAKTMLLSCFISIKNLKISLILE